MELKDRFLKYVSYDTQSSEQSRTFPSTDKQLVLLRELADEMKALGMTEVTMDAHGYVMGTVPASKGCENAPVIGFIAHASSLRHSFALIAVFGLMTAVLARFLRRN